MAPATSRLEPVRRNVASDTFAEFRAINNGRQPMFNNLIESSSHRKEFKRRGSFFLFTVGTYAMLFAITGVASIYAYDANLGEQTYEVVTMLPPVDIASAPKPVDPEPPNTPHNGNSTYDVRRHPTAPVDTPLLVPKEISTKQNPDLPVRHGVPTVVGGADSNALLPGTRGVTGNATQVSLPVNIVDDPPPPAPPAPKPPATILKVSRVLNSQALALPRPTYPIMARQIRLQGAVNVQVLIDETGKVISAKAVSGHPLLIVAAQQAAMQARFSPTIVGEQPVKVSGVITYNFVMQ